MAKNNNGQSGSVDLIDPIQSITNLGSEFNGTPDYEKMFTFVSMKATRRPKSVINNQGGNTSLGDSLSTLNINMLGYDQQTSQFTTKWSNNIDTIDTIYEGFGISSIDISTNSSFIPQVDVEFRDIRGSAFFNLGEKSPYSVLFDFPPPIFELTVKGYYGRALTYQLHLTKHSEDFDAERGDFVIKASFVARTFAPLSDVPLKYVDLFPLIRRETLEPVDPEIQQNTLNDNRPIDTSRINTSSKIPPRNLNELVKKLESLYDDIAELRNNSNEARNLDRAQGQLNNANSIIGRLNNFRNLVDDRTLKNATKIIIKQDIDSDSGDFVREISNVGLFDSVLQSNETNFVLANANEITGDRLFLSFLINNTDLVNSDQTSLSTPLTNNINKIEVELNRIRNILLDDAQDNNIAVNTSDIGTPKYIRNYEIENTLLADPNQVITYYGIDITTYYSKVFDFVTKKRKEVTDNNALLVGEVNQAAIDNLGQIPTIYFIFEILCDSIDEFFDILRQTNISAERHHNKNNIRETIIDSPNIKESKITSFPLYISSTTTNCVTRETRAIPTDLSNRTRNKFGEPFPEITLIDDFLEAFIINRKRDRVRDLRTQEDERGNNKWIPVTPADSSLINRNKESPFTGIEFQYQDKGINQTIDKIFNKIIERFYVASQYTWGVQFYDNAQSYTQFQNRVNLKVSKIIEYAAGAEAVNLAQSLTNNNVINVLKNLSRNADIDQIFTQWAEKIPAYNRVNIESTVGTSEFAVIGNDRRPPIPDSESDSVGGAATIDDINLLYKDRRENTFFGVKILSDQDFPEIRSNDENDLLSPVDKFLNSSETNFFEDFTNWFKGGSNTVKEFTRENIVYVSDSESNNNFETRYISSYSNGVLSPLVGSLSNTLSIRFTLDNFGKELLDFLRSSENIYIKAFFVASNFLKSRSFFDEFSSDRTQLNDSFVFPSVVAAPYFSILYMGGLVEYVSDSGRVNQETFDNMLDGFTLDFNEAEVQQFSDLSRFKRDAELVDKLLSENDKREFSRFFIDFVENEFNDLNSQYIRFLEVVENQKSNIEDLNFFQRFFEFFSAYGNALPVNLRKIGVAYETQLQGDFSDITNFLYKKYAVVVTNQFTFAIPEQNEETGEFLFPEIETGLYQPLSVTNSDERRVNNVKYFQEFFKVLGQNIETQEEELDEIENETIGAIGDSDIKTQLYYSFKSISDKWIAGDSANRKGFPLNKNNERLIDKFMFVDRAMNPIGNDCVINVEPLLDLVKDYDVSVFSVMSQLLSHNGFEFFPLQNFMSFEKNEWKDGFKIFESIQQEAVPAFVCMYIGGGSSFLDNPLSDYDNDGIIDLSTDTPPDFKNNDCNTPEVEGGRRVSFNNVEQPYSQVKAFRVRYAEQNQSFFNNIGFDGRDFTETNDSLAILSRIAGDDSKTSPVPKGQNLFSVYENRAYSARVTMLGNMLIQPTQYFQIENVPLYGGAYVILDVQHSFQPNHAITTFQGTKVLKYPNPIVSEFATTVGFQSGTAEDTSAVLTLEELRNSPQYEQANRVGFVDDLIRAESITTFSERNDELIRTLHPSVRADFADLINAWFEAGFPMRINSAFRTFQKQRELRNRFEAGLSGGLPASQPGQSFHNFGLAIDVSLFDTDSSGNLTGNIITKDRNPSWEIIGRIAEERGFRWGGRFNNFDPVHFEKTNGYGYRENDFSAKPIFDGSTPRYDTKGTRDDLTNRYFNGQRVGEYVYL